MFEKKREHVNEENTHGVFLLNLLFHILQLVCMNVLSRTSD